METAEKKQADWAVLWQEERQTLSLQGEPVPEVWRRRWSRALYWHACLDLARCREQSHPFHPWQAHLEGRVLFQDQDSLSIRLDAEEVHGDGRPLRVRMGDVWSLPEGVPLPAGGGLLPGSGFWAPLASVSVPPPVLPHPRGTGILCPTVRAGPGGRGGRGLLPPAGAEVGA